MKKYLTILSLLLIVTMAFPIEAATRTGRTVILKKQPLNHKDKDIHKYRSPSIVVTCYVDKDSGLQPLDTSEIVSYEVWDCTDTVPIVLFEDEEHFVDYILNDDAQGIIKLFSQDYMYIGELDSQTEL